MKEKKKESIDQNKEAIRHIEDIEHLMGGMIKNIKEEIETRKVQKNMDEDEKEDDDEDMDDVGEMGEHDSSIKNEAVKTGPSNPMFTMKDGKIVINQQISP